MHVQIYNVFILFIYIYTCICTGIAHLIGFSATTLLYDLIFCNCLSFLIKELKAYIESIPEHLSKDIKVVVKRLNAAYVIVGRFAFLT
jgi:hypothetical protein